MDGNVPFLQCIVYNGVGQQTDPFLLSLKYFISLET